jgi:glyoxylase I family protein
VAIRDATNLDYVVLPCRALEGSVSFYTDVIGLAIVERRPGWVNFRVGSSILALRRRSTDEEISSDAMAQIAFRVPPSRLDHCHQELLAHGVAIERGPIELPSWGHRAMFFRDPEGHLLELYAEG